MIIIRPITLKDREAFEQFAYTTHVGITSLPRNPDVLHEKILKSLESFEKKVKKPGNELYLFILEDLTSGKQGGTCGIFAKIGLDVPLYFFKIDKEIHESSTLPLTQETRILRSGLHTEPLSEICGLYLLPEFRHGGVGRLLSLSRFLFIAEFPERFSSKVISNMRGVIDEHSQSPFWNGLGAHFLHIDFNEVMHMLSVDTYFIQQFLPKHPIYVALLSKEAQDAINTTHHNTRPALEMLRKEGFQMNDEIDVFDGGPLIHAKTQEIRTVRESKIGIVSITGVPLDSPSYILSNARLDFRACFAKAAFKGEEILINQETAEALRVKNGDRIRYATSGHET